MNVSPGATHPVLCPKCSGPDLSVGLVAGKAIEQTYTAGMPDFIGETRGITYSPGGPGRLIGCLKCPVCGYSITYP